jgi:hypothetical protein
MDAPDAYFDILHFFSDVQAEKKMEIQNIMTVKTQTDCSEMEPNPSKKIDICMRKTILLFEWNL